MRRSAFILFSLWSSVTFAGVTIDRQVYKVDGAEVTLRQQKPVLRLELSDAATAAVIVDLPPARATLATGLRFARLRDLFLNEDIDVRIALDPVVSEQPALASTVTLPAGCAERLVPAVTVRDVLEALPPGAQMILAP